MDEAYKTLRDRLSYLIDNKSITPYAIWRETGISQATLSNILNGKTKRASGKTLELLSKYFNVNKEWLRSGDVNINNGNQITAHEINGNITQHVDNRSYYSDSPDVLRAEIDKLDRIITEVPTVSVAACRYLPSVVPSARLVKCVRSISNGICGSVV